MKQTHRDTPTRGGSRFRGENTESKRQVKTVSWKSQLLDSDPKDNDGNHGRLSPALLYNPLQMYGSLAQNKRKFPKETYDPFQNDESSDWSTLTKSERAQCRAWRNATLLEQYMVDLGQKGADSVSPDTPRVSPESARAVGYPIVVLPSGDAISFAPFINSVNLYTSSRQEALAFGYTPETIQEHLLSFAQLREECRLPHRVVVRLEDLRAWCHPNETPGKTSNLQIGSVPATFSDNPTTTTTETDHDSTPANKGVVHGREWLIDSGAGVHLCPKELVTDDNRFRSKEPITLETANGRFSTDERAWMYVPGLHLKVECVVLENGCCALSLGKLVKQGCHFEWKPGHEVPTILNPAGEEAFVWRDRNCPYINGIDYPTGTAAAATVQSGSSDADTQGVGSVPHVPLGGDPASRDDGYESEGDTVPPPPVPRMPDFVGHQPRDGGNPYDEPPLADIDMPESDKDHMSTQHLLTHFPYNPKCEVCVRANKRRKTHRRVKREHELKATRFGEVITMDFVSNHREQVEGLHGQIEALVMYDIYSKWLQVYPMNGRTAKQVAICVQKFLGTAKCRVCYSDRAPELIKAMEMWGVPHEGSLPGKPQTNGVIEMCVGRIARGTRALLAASGLPENFWPLAANAFCFGHNSQKDTNGRSPWNTRRRRELCAPLLPFGAYVNYIPPTTTTLGRDRTKFSTKTEPGVFLGYEIGYGGSWRGGHVVAPLEAFVGVPLRAPNKAQQHRLSGRITVTEEALMPSARPWFPLIDQAHYENRTLKGLSTPQPVEEEGMDPGTGDSPPNTLLGADLVSPDDDDLFGDRTEGDDPLDDFGMPKDQQE